MSVTASVLQPAQIDNPRSTRLPLIAYVNDRDTLSVLTDALAPALGSTAEFRLGTLAETRAGLQRLTTPVAAVLVDISGQSDPLAALEDLALYIEPSVRVFVIGDVEDMEFYRHVVRGLGAQEYLRKPLTREVVARRLLPPLTGGKAAQTRGGRIITVTGVHGGVGATTVSVNLAVQLADRSRHHVLLFDADLHGGAAPLMLSAGSVGGLRAALENPERVDVLFAERSSPAVSDRLHLLAAEEALNHPIVPSDGAVEHLAALLSNRFNLIVVDLPRHGATLNNELCDLAHVRVLVMDPTLPALRDTLRHLAIPNGPRQASRPLVVLNHLGAPGTLTRKQVTEGLGRDVDVTIPWLPKRLHAAATLGQPAVRQRGAFQTAITQLAAEIVPQRADVPKTRAGLLKWISR